MYKMNQRHNVKNADGTYTRTFSEKDFNPNDIKDKDFNPNDIKDKVETLLSSKGKSHIHVKVIKNIPIIP